MKHLWKKSLWKRKKRSETPSFLQNLLILIYLFPIMTDETDVSIRMAEDAIKYIYTNYPNLTCGDYIAFSSVLVHNVAKWIAETMHTDVKEIENIIFSQVIQLEVLEKDAHE